MRSQVGLRKHHYKQSYWRRWNFSWAISNPKRWCCESTTFNMPANLENSAVATGLEKVCFNYNPKERQFKECSNYCTIALISHASKVMLKILSKPCFNGMWTMKFQMFNLVLENIEEPEIKLATSAGTWKKQESSRKTSTSALLTTSKPLSVWITTDCGKFLKRWEYQTILPASWEICMQVKKQ